MKAKHHKVLAYLCDLTLPDGEMCVGFASLSHHCEMDRQEVRRIVRHLARKGLAEYYRGLVSEFDGAFAGAGYCITRAGMVLMEPEVKK